MTDLRLGVHGLPAAEAGLVRALLSLAGPIAGIRWNFVAAGPCDVLMADDREATVEQARAERRASAVLLLGAHAETGTNALSRPLRAEQFEACLQRLAQGITPAGATPPAEPPPVAAAAARRRYKLLRWPPAELLRAEPHRIRIASQMSRRHLSADEIAQLTQVDTPRVLTFLQLLQGFGLLQPQPEVALPLAAAPAFSALARVAGGRSLVQSIRRRLGL